ncbi:MAG: PcfJ domain-containing protein [Solidesulfovibrio sp.]|uniref:PcfJ domain-containing protein n=1 Tax=Solidesulfovibrio sp. TaxID=2910990 RepID=UPI00315981FE
MIIGQEFCSLHQGTGMLTLDLRDLYGFEGGLVRIAPWHDRLLVERMDKHGWVQDDTALDYPLITEATETLPKGHPMRRFCEGLPAWASDTARPFRINQLRLLRILSVDPKAQELAVNAPIVFWLLAECLGDQASTEDILGLTRCRRRDILGKALGDSSNSLLNFLCKLDKFSYELTDLERLRLLVAGKAWVGLRHMGRLNWQVLKLFLKQDDWLDYSGVRRLLHVPQGAVALERFNQWKRVAGDIQRIAAVLQLQPLTERLKQVRDHAQLRRLHDTLTARLNRQRALEIEGRFQKPFPLAPLPGDQVIQPITNVSDLLDEGTAMHHCVASYIDLIFEGKSFIYKVLAPERATLQIVRLPDGKLRVGQLKLACNAETSQETVNQVSNWFNTVYKPSQTSNNQPFY